MIESKNIRCALIFLGPFPIGNVSTIRIMSYCKALAKKDVYVKVLLISPTTEAACNNYISGIVDGVEYQYITDITWKKNNPFLGYKIYYYIVGLFKSVSYLKKDKINCLLSYHNEFVSNLFYWIVTRFMSMPFILDKTEYPSGYNSSFFLKRMYEISKLKFYDGQITITQELYYFYKKVTNKPVNKLFLLPMTIDLERYDGIFKQSVSKPFMSVVFGTHNRDGLYDSIVAYHTYLKLIDNNNAFRLILIGDFDGLCKRFPDCNKIKEYISENNINDQIDFKGLLPINEVPQILVNSSCLMTTPRNYESGGFPTKLGEYLLSRVPVVATDVGEIRNYLTHEKDILLSLPSDYLSIANNILYVQMNSLEAEKIALSAIESVKKFFNAEQYVDQLIAFIQNIGSNDSK